MDHFAKPGDELAVAQRQGRLTRDFQGYSSGGDCDCVGLGVSAIGRIGSAYCQSEKKLDRYYARLDRDELPVLRGIQLTPDDLVRRAVIQALACHFELAKESIEIAYLIDFDNYFATELADLEKLEADGLVVVDDEWIRVTPRGRLLVRAACMVFDRYLRVVEKAGGILAGHVMPALAAAAFGAGLLGGCIAPGCAGESSARSRSNRAAMPFRASSPSTAGASLPTR
jgi:oxygen-independent coproporphyrinogen-3 oxidase